MLRRRRKKKDSMSGLKFIYYLSMIWAIVPIVFCLYILVSVHLQGALMFFSIISLPLVIFVLFRENLERIFELKLSERARMGYFVLFSFTGIFSFFFLMFPVAMFPDMGKIKQILNNTIKEICK